MQKTDLSSTLGRRLAVSVVAVNVFVIGLVSVSLQQSRERARAEAGTVGQNLARLLETSITASFDQIDVALLAIADEHERQARAGAIDADAFRTFLARQKARAPDLQSLHTTDERGLTQYDVPASPAPLSLAERDFFVPLREDPAAGLFVSRPYLGRIVGKPLMVFSRRLARPDGSFAGVATGAVELARLGQILSQVDVGPHGVVTLRWKDMTLLARKSATAIHVELGDRTVSPELQRVVAAGAQTATYDARSILDGTRRTFSVRRFGRYPLHVIVGLATEDYQAEWRRQVVGAAVLLAGFVLLTGALAASALRFWRRRLEYERLLVERSERLRDSEERFRIAFQTSPDAINLNRLDDGVYVAVNEGFMRMTGWTEGEVLGRSSLELGVWDDPADRERLVEALQRDGSVDNLEARFRGKNRVTTGLMSARLITIGGGQLVLSITRDVSDLKRAEQERDRLQEQVRQAQKLESIGQLAGGVAHDFNNLLTVILSCAEELRSDLAAGAPPNPEDVEQIESAGQRARDLTRQLLAFARKQVITPVRLDVGAVIRNGERMLRRVLREDVSLRVGIQEGLWPVWCDPGQIEQVLLNLAVNARDAMPGGGTLAIEARNLRVEASAAAPDRPAGDWVQVVVRDDGVGMSPQVKAHLFEPFFTTKDPGKGTGLGLATVHGIVTQSGGHLRVESASGAGTRFEICFPRTERAAPAPAPHRSGTSVGTETILVIEDDAQVREVTVRALQGAGYRTLVASDGSAGLELIEGRTAGIDLLLTDVVMPGMGGTTVAEELRRRMPGLRVLFVSGYAKAASLDHGAAGSPMQFLAKPFTSTALLERVRQLLDAAPARAGAA